MVCLSQEEGFFETLLLFIGSGKVALLQAYFDESERSNGLLCVAGYAFAAPQAKKLTREFKALFDPYGGFHMVDLVAKRKGFRGISDLESERLIKAAVKVVNKRFSYGVAVTVNLEEYNSQAPRFIRGMGNAYPFLCYMAMTAMAMKAREHGDCGPITYIFEAGHAHEKEARFAVGQIAGHPELKHHYLHHGDSFLPKSDAVPLQAADLLAWESAKFVDETVDRKVREIRLSLLRLFAANTKRYSVAVCQGAALTRAMVKWWELAADQMEEDIAMRLQPR